jgi:hydroxyacylglutathione hydrolase
MSQLKPTEDPASREAVAAVRAFADNYIWLLGGRTRGGRRYAAIVDPGDPQPVLAALARTGIEPVAILCTHHHGDHVGGVAALAAYYRIPVYGPACERIPAITHRLAEGDTVELEPLERRLTVLEVPGHTAGHIAYYGDGMLFCGDTLFSAGCGRLFEGTPQQMHASLARLCLLPDETAVYCAHEYTLANLRFALAVEPDNRDTHEYRQRCERRRAEGLPTLPSTIGLEKAINPFLRTHHAAVRAAAERHAGRPLSSEVEVFAVLRRWKDDFGG